MQGLILLSLVFLIGLLTHGMCYHFLYGKPQVSVSSFKRGVRDKDINKQERKKGEGDEPLCVSTSNNRVHYFHVKDYV